MQAVDGEDGVADRELVAGLRLFVEAFVEQSCRGVPREALRQVEAVELGDVAEGGLTGSVDPSTAPEQAEEDDE